MHGLAEYTNEMVDYVTSICTFPIITSARTKKEKKAVHNELLMHQTYPSNPLYNLMNSILFRPEGLVVQDDTKLQIKNLDHITVAHLKKWFHKFYGAGNIIFVISGNFSKQKILNIIKNKLSKVPPIRIIPKYNDIFTVGNEIKFLKNNSIENSTIMFSFHSQLYQKDMEIFYIDFFKEFIGSGITSLIMEELREKKQLIYNVGLDNYTTPYGTYITLEISCKNKDIEDVVKGTLKILKKLANGKFKTEYLSYVKQAYMVEHYETCLNNSYLSGFFGEQYINQIYNFEEKPVILTFDQVAKSILKISKPNFVLFVKKLLIFSNMKIAYQGKREVKNLPALVLNKI
jgi:predicted Zn-dependent peptidase